MVKERENCTFFRQKKGRTQADFQREKKVDIISDIQETVREISVIDSKLQVILPENFKAGRLKHFKDKWEEITSDETILDCVSGCHIDLVENDEENIIKNMKPINFNEKEKEIVNKEILKLWEKGVIEKTKHCENEIISNIFIRLKKDKSYRVIINLKNLNKIVEYHHFKMESLASAIKLMVNDCFMASVDLKDAYYSVPVALEHRKWLKFEWENELWQFTSLAMGLACSPRKFTKLMKPRIFRITEKGMFCGTIH